MINEEIVKLIKSYSDKYYVCVELGLQTASDEIGKTINRGYTTERFVEAVELLNKYDIDVIAHIMCGLPGENRDGKNVPIQIKELTVKHQACAFRVHSV